ncbi:MAG: lipoprotein-releasing ABC transporter permease subunit [Deltaproteobacteria bacterium]|nr:lipoprotein-releasing ABC transporter permease subunit [Deltaproteobacteria bacterium]MBW2339303.1 lipoprotein-releasing ABC transporter permease subunit [Deltaproteobacteria bacterium]
MSFETFFSLRYLKAKRKQGFISVITAISILGIMIGVMALIVVLAVMNGFREDLMKKILGVNSHLLILSYKGGISDTERVIQEALEVDGVLSATAVVYSQVMIKNYGNISGAVLRGIDPATVGTVIEIDSMIRGGSVDLLKDSGTDPPGIILGSQLSKQIGAAPGDTVTLVSPIGKLTPLGRVPSEGQFKVKALFESGMYEYDSSMVYLSLPDAQDFLSLGDEVTVIELKVKDIDQSDTIGKRIQEKLGYPYWTKDWKMMNRSLFSALKLEKVTMFIILTMIVLVGALNIISSLVMMVMEKNRDIAILRTMGASPKSIMSIFIFQGLFVGLIGTLLGLMSGSFLCHILARYKFIKLPPDVYYITTLPVRMEWLDVISIVFAAVIISFLATIYPSWQASKVNPVEALRYE